MESYITRVEVLNPSSTDYYELYSAMERRGFSRRIICDERTGYHFPLGEFCYHGAEDLNQVLALITEAALEILKPCAVEIIESDALQPSEWAEGKSSRGNAVYGISNPGSPQFTGIASPRFAPAEKI